MKYKKMTLKEFKEVINDENIADMNFDTWGYEGFLNLIAIATRHLARQAEAMGCEYSAKRDYKRAEQITDYLQDRGYFDSEI